MSKDLKEHLRQAASDPAQIRELISMEAERLADEGKGPTVLVDALVSEDLAGLAPLAAERHFHAFYRRLEDEQGEYLADHSPVFDLNDKTLVAAPVGNLGQEGFARFCDRVLTKVLMTNPKRVLIVTEGLAPYDGLEDDMNALTDDLKRQGVKTGTRATGAIK
jgi:hypothetical protein